MLIFYAALGFLLATSANFPFPETYRNSPYVLSYLIGILSLICIFSTTILAAQSLFREKDARFDAILFSAPLRKGLYVFSRFLIIFCITLLCYFIFLIGLMVGHLLAANGNEEYGAFSAWNYLQPFFVLLLPNIIFCTAVACVIGLTTKNKMLVYISGVFIYFLYWAIAIFTNSPLVANSAPISESAMSMGAKLDPFGLAAFSEQTNYWTAAERNTKLVQLTGNFLLNRIIYMAISFLLLLLAYRRFSFNTLSNKRSRQRSSTPPPSPATIADQPVPTRSGNFYHHLKSLWSLISIELRSIVKSIPLWIFCFGWMAFLSIELFSTIDGNRRMPPLFASTAVMIREILGSLPMVAILSMLFYGGEIFWRSKHTRFAALEDATALGSFVSLFSKFLSLVFIPALLISASILVGVLLQFLFGYPHFNWGLYASLFYLIGLPMVLNAALIVSVHAFLKNKYMGMAISGIILLATSTSMGSMLGLQHPLLKYANAFNGMYSEMSGFGQALQAFDLKMIYWMGIAAIILLLASIYWRKKRGEQNYTVRKFLRSPWSIVLVLCVVGAVASGYRIYSNTRVVKGATRNDWAQAYEEKYSRIKNIPQPFITRVTTHIDLYPGQSSLQVTGEYMLQNKTQSPIDTLFIYGDQEMKWSDWTLEKGKLQQQDPLYGYYIFVLQSPLQPGDSVLLKFGFQYKASPFNKPAAYNNILENGSFSRISRYFPAPGYNADNEIDDPRERAKRKLSVSGNVLPLEEERSTADSYGFVQLDATISTISDQTAIGVGELMGQWKKDNRNYFRYATTDPIPFRFAVASARYAVKKFQHNNTVVEVYYHPGHYQQIDHLINVSKQTLDYCEKQLGAYPSKTLRFVEISSFTRGFAGTAYPTNLFINESFGFQNKVEENPARDIIHEMVSHEVSHVWWGNAKIAPDYREGSKLMTETLAMYNELMVYKKTYGETYLPERVLVHKDLYLANRGMGDEEPLYKSHPAKPHLCYDKGMVVMYQLYKLLGEEKINAALRQFYHKYAYPNPPPIANDLINEFYAVSDKIQSAKIDEWFKQIVTYDLKLQKANVTKDKNGQYQVNILGTAIRYNEDGKGKATPVPFTEPLEAVVYFDNDQQQTILLTANGNQIDTTLSFPAKPIKVILDPAGRFLDRLSEDNEKKVSVKPR